MTPLLLSAFTATSCLGRGLDATRQALHAGRSGLAPCAFETVKLDTWVGEVAGVDDETLPAALADYLMTWPANARRREENPHVS